MNKQDKIKLLNGIASGKTSIQAIKPKKYLVFDFTQKGGIINCGKVITDDEMEGIIVAQRKEFNLTIYNLTHDREPNHSAKLFNS